ncbi:MAG TPA: zinc ABC transporter substrate-binding protein [Chloroflexota bacterium]|nr:zinc ABC transporter substrate-binding protein [Chloroflexota bacterium]
MRSFYGVTLLLLTLVLAASVACSSVPASAGGDLSGRKIRAVTTIGQIGDLVHNVGGDRVEVIALMGPGVDPHLYKASEGDVTRLNSADIIFYNGLNLEGKMSDLFVRLARTRPAVAVTEDIPVEQLLEPPEFAGHYDPHIWFDVTMWKQATGTVERALSELDPANAATYQANADRYRQELDALHEWAASEITTIPRERRVLVTAHDAFGYFGQQYDVEVVGLQGISTESEAGVGDVQALADLIASRGVKAMFVESSVPHRNIEAVQAAVRAKGNDVIIGGEIFSDAMGEPGTPTGTYIGMFQHNVETIVTALR